MITRHSAVSFLFLFFILSRWKLVDVYGSYSHYYNFFSFLGASYSGNRFGKDKHLAVNNLSTFLLFHLELETNISSIANPSKALKRWLHLSFVLVFIFTASRAVTHVKLREEPLRI